MSGLRYSCKHVVFIDFQVESWTELMYNRLDGYRLVMQHLVDDHVSVES